MVAERNGNRQAASVSGIVRMAGMAIIAGLAGFAGVDAASVEEEGATYARVRDLQDDMTVARSAEGEIFSASLNAPILPGDRAWTEGSRAEIELADASLLWLDEWTRVGFRSLSDIGMAYAENNLIVLEEGSIRINTFDPEEDAQAFQIDTEAGTIYLLSGGEFRIDASGGMTTLSSISGVAELSGDGGSILVRSGERSSVRTDRTPSSPRHFNTARFDDFDRYCEDRTFAYLRTEEEPIPEGVGEQVPVEVHHYIHELSFYGRWYSVPSYGWVWRPAYHGAWGPYHDGYWTWCATGWSWVSYEPWGWAPYHYGRWDHVSSIGWVWIPGRRWSGAWVSFAVGPSYIGWAPLNYYNRPVFHDAGFVARGTVRGADLHTRGWQFARYEQFARRDRARPQTRGDRIPQDSPAVLTGRLPHFDQTATAKRPEPRKGLIDTVKAAPVPLPSATDDSGREVPFRKLERPPASPPGKSRRGTPRTRSLSARAPADGNRQVPVQPRGRLGSVPPARRDGSNGSSGNEDGGLRRAPGSLGLSLENEGGAAAGRDTTDRGGERGNRTSKEKPGGHAVEKLFRGSRQRTSPRPLSEDSMPDKSRARPRGSQGRAAGAGESGSKRSAGRENGAAGKSPDRQQGKAEKSPGRRPEASDRSSAGKDKSTKKEDSSRERGSERGSERGKERKRGR